MRKSPTSLRRRGSAAIEFALWLPVLFILLSAVIDWGAYWATRVTIARATMDGARMGAARFEPDQIAGSAVTPGSLVVPEAEARAESLLTSMGKPCPGCATAQYCPAGVATGVCNHPTLGPPPFDALHIRVDYTFTPFFGWASTPTLISEEFLMAVERQR